MDPYGDVAEQYRDFAGHTHGESPCLEEWSRGVADDPEVAAWIATLPGLKTQPNLVFAAARWHGVAAPGPYAGLRAALLGDDDAGGPIRATIMSRSTQTNEVGRLATVVPAIRHAVPRGPVALIEAGASAGLNLFPDRWGYWWTTPHGPVELGPEPRLRCEVTGAAPLLEAPLEVAWRGGVDLNPLDVRDADQMRWLATLVWPEQAARVEVLRHAVHVAAADPPSLVTGDLLDELPDLVALAASEVDHTAPVVVFHTAVIAYLEEPDRERFHDLMTRLVADGACHWVSNESPRVLPRVAATGPAAPAQRFVLAVDGQAVGFTQAHGRALHWLDS